MKKVLDIRQVFFAILCVAFLFWIIYDREDAKKEEVVQEPTVEVFDTTGWKTYQSDEYGFEFKYPAWIQVSQELLLDDKRGVKYPLLTLQVQQNVPEYVLCPSLFSLIVGYIKVELTDAHIAGNLNAPLKVSFIFPGPGELSLYHQGLLISCPSGISESERQAIANSTNYLKSREDKAIKELIAPQTLFQGFTLDTTNWGYYKNDSEEIGFKYPLNATVRLTGGEYYGFQGKDNVAVISIAPVTGAGFELGVGWTKYQSLDDKYPLSCVDGGGEGCGSRSYRDDVEQIVKNMNVSANNYPARYWTSTGIWSGYDAIMEHHIDIALPSVLVHVRGTVEGVSRFGSTGTHLSREMEALVKRIAGTIVDK